MWLIMGPVSRMVRFIPGIALLVGGIVFGLAISHAQAQQAQDENIGQALERRDKIIQQLLERVGTLEQELRALKEGQAKPEAAAPGIVPPQVAGPPPSTPQPQVPSPPAAAAPAAPSPPAEEEEREVPRVPLASVERGGSLLRSGSFQIETSLGYTHSETSHLILTGFSVLPLIIMGTLESERIKQDILTPTVRFRYGLLKDLQAELSVPMTYQIQSRIRVSNQAAGLVAESANQFGLGDIEGAITYQPIYESGWIPDVTVSLRARAPTGRSQFDIFDAIVKKGPFADVEDFVSRLNAEGLPLGSGFWGLSGSVSAVKAFDPVILFGTVGYGYNFERRATTVSITSEPAEGGVRLFPTALQSNVKSGDNVSLSFGFAVVLTNQVSVSFSFLDQITFKTRVNGLQADGSDTNVGQFQTGFTLAVTPRVSLNITGTIGLTPDAPNLGLGASVSTSFASIRDLWPFGKE